MIIEQVPDESLKIQTQDGSLFVYTMDEHCQNGQGT